MRDKVIPFLKSLRESIIDAFQKIETEGSFARKSWNYEKGVGGGEMAILRGAVFEKAAVNFSAVSGDVFPGSDGSGPFFATGVSLITHMSNPNAPTVHMNIRYIETVKGYWYGGGYDLTPMGKPFDEDTKHFHAAAERALKPFGEDIYPTFKQNAADYFYIPHRKKERGVGGIFFDHFRSENDFALWCAVGNSFLEAIIPIYQKRVALPFSQEDKNRQLLMRGHYAEFNLVYDRGTKFGFLSEGNPDAILCSMPPVASW